MTCMFTGLVEEVGKVKSITSSSDSYVITVECEDVLDGTYIGDSIAVNGVCLTVTGISGGVFSADVMPETLHRSSLASLKSGSKVNLERAMAAGGRFGGHMVSGHIDGTGHIENIVEDVNAVWYTISADADILKYIVEKGSVALDGISLTVAYVDDDVFKVSVIPHTRQVTNMLSHGVGSIINIECDVIGKYVEKMLATVCDEPKKKSRIDETFLAQNGFL